MILFDLISFFFTDFPLPITMQNLRLRKIFVSFVLCNAFNFSELSSGRVDRTLATETVDWGSITGLVKSKTCN